MFCQFAEEKLKKLIKRWGPIVKNESKAFYVISIEILVVYSHFFQYDLFYYKTQNMQWLKQFWLCYVRTYRNTLNVRLAHLRVSVQLLNPRYVSHNNCQTVLETLYALFSGTMNRMNSSSCTSKVSQKRELSVYKYCANN